MMETISLWFNGRSMDLSCYLLTKVISSLTNQASHREPSDHIARNSSRQGNCKVAGYALDKSMF